MSIQNNFPAIAPSLNLSFALTKELDPRITFTRASTATYYGTQVAKAEENLFLYSQQMNLALFLDRTTVTADSTTAPDGTTTADTFTNTTATGAHAGLQTINVVAGNQYTLSVFSKKNTHDFLQLTTFAVGNPTGSGRANFNLATGAAGTVDGGTSSITDAGNGWYRCTYTVTATANAAVNFYFGIVTSSTAVRFESYTGLGTESVYLWGAQLEQRSAVTAYTATTTQPITNYIPKLLTAASGVARFDSNPTTGESLGLLIEEQRTNLVTYSEQFDNAVWTKTNSTITANTIVAPDGALTGDKLVENTANSTHQLATAATSSATSATFSFYAKPAERSEIIVQCYTSPANTGGTVQFNLLSKTVVSQTVISTGTVSGASITDVGDGWVRCVVSVTGTSSTNLVGVIYLVSGTNTYTGNGYSGIFIWGAQLEAGAFATSYIPTVASQVTRAADAASMTGANFSSWYRQDEGTLYAEFTGRAISTAAVVNDGSSSNRMPQISIGAASNYEAYVVRSNSVIATLLPAGTHTFGTPVKFAVAIQLNSSAAAANAAISTATAPAALPTGLSQLNIGSTPTGGILNGTIRKIAFYPARVTNAQLQGLTS